MIKLVSWNIRHSKGRDGIVDINRIGETLKSIGGDIYTIQEVDILSNRSGKINQPEVLSSTLGMNNYFTPISRVKSGRYGIVTLTNFEVAQKRDLVLTKRSENHSAQEIRFLRNDEEISLINLHAPWKINEVYWQGFSKCVTLGASILSGDFNLYPQDPFIQQLNEFYNYQNPTYSSTYQDGTILDYTYSPYRVISQEVIPTRQSDHNILITTIDL